MRSFLNNNSKSLPHGIKATGLSRRAVLQAALTPCVSLGVSLGLPTLNVMLNENGTAFAEDNKAIPKRFGTYYWGCGIHYNSWIPSSTGYNWVLPEAFADFQDLKNYLTIMTNFSHRGSSPGHIPARGISLSASHDLTKGIPGAGTYRGQNHPEPSVDAIMSEAWKSETVFDMLGVSICRNGPYKSLTSWKSGGRSNHQEPSPQKLYDRIFSVALPDNQTSDLSMLDTTSQLRISMLDAVKTDASRLRQQLGSEDRQRLDQHFDSIRALEIKLGGDALNGISCSQSDRPVQSHFGDGGTREQKEAKSQLMSDLIALAFSCDLTRVVAYEFSANQSEAVYWEVNELGTHHNDISHGKAQKDPNKKITQFIMKNLAYFARKLSDISVGPDTLLDHTLIFGTSEHADAGAHNYSNHPLIFVGGGGGSINNGLHYKASSGETNAGRVLLTAVRAMGIDRPTLGQAATNREVSEVISSLLT